MRIFIIKKLIKFFFNIENNWDICLIKINKLLTENLVAA